jgi:hypothetical protein
VPREIKILFFNLSLGNFVQKNFGERASFPKVVRSFRQFGNKKPMSAAFVKANAIDIGF